MPIVVPDILELFTEWFDEQMKSSSSLALWIGHLSPKWENVNVNVNIKLETNAIFVENFLVYI